MATRKPSRAARAAKRPARKTKPTRAARKPSVTRKPMAAVSRPLLGGGMDKRRLDPQTLRLRAFEPSLTVSDLQKSMEFYTKTLGFILGERWEEGGVLKGVTLKAGACQLGLSQDDWSKGRDRVKGQGFRLWCETVQDINALADRIKRAGGVLAQGPTDDAASKMQSLAVDDLDGYHITIYRNKA